jgi:hypothetical protein
MTPALGAYVSRGVDSLPRANSKENPRVCLFDVHKADFSNWLLMHYVTTHPPALCFPSHFNQFFVPQQLY